jgi:ferrous iron transport protein A
LTHVKRRGVTACSHAAAPLRSEPVSEAVSPKIADGDVAEKFVCPLTQVPPGTVCRVKQVLASPELTLRLREMGFCEQQKIKLLAQQRTLICQVCNARLGLSERLAETILVEPLSRRKAGA